MNPECRADSAPPRGTFPGRLDDQGRLKLPPAFVAYLERFAVKTCFVTSVDGCTLRIYPFGGWQSEMASGRLPASEFAVLNVVDLGADSEMDAAGRILIPERLRRQLQMENASVRMYFFRSHIQVLREALYEALRDPAGFRKSMN